MSPVEGGTVWLVADGPLVDPGPARPVEDVTWRGVEVVVGCAEEDVVAALVDDVVGAAGGGVFVSGAVAIGAGASEVVGAAPVSFDREVGWDVDVPFDPRR